VRALTISRQLGHGNVQITLSTYAHFFTRRTDSGLGATLEALVAKEIGCVLVAPNAAADEQHTEVIDSIMATGGIEPPTRGFSVPASNRFKLLIALNKAASQCPIFP
jgi:hypothetical protein